MGTGDLRNIACICGSGKKAKHCCLTANGWHKSPVAIDLRVEKSKYQNPKCFLSEFKGCSRKISKEHYISKSVLKNIEGKPGHFKIEGLPWITATNLSFIGINNLVAYILCKNHNQMLSPLDTVGLQFLSFLDQINLNIINNTNSHYLLNGHDIERWLLKTLAGLLISKNIKNQYGNQITQVVSPKVLLERIFDPKKWINFVGLRFYPDDCQFYSNHLGIAPACLKNKIVGGYFKIKGLFFILNCTEFLQYYSNTKVDIYRPKKFIFIKNNIKQTLEFSWSDSRYQHEIKLELPS